MACPATGLPHVFERASDNANGAYVACTECGTGTRVLPPVRPAACRRQLPAVIFDEPDEWSLR